MYVLQLEGEGRGQIEECASRVEFMAASLPLPEDHAPLPRPLLIMFVCRTGEGEGGKSPSVTQQLEIGCIKTPLVKKVVTAFYAHLK